MLLRRAETQADTGDIHCPDDSEAQKCAEDYTYSTPHKARASKDLEAGGVAVTSTSVYELASFPQDDEHYSTPTDISQSHRDAWSRDSTVAGTTNNGLDSYNHLALQNPREALGGAAKPDAYDHLSGYEAHEDGHGKGPQQLTGKGKPGYENVTSFAETPPPRHDEYNTLDREHPPGHRDLEDIQAQYNHLNEQAHC
nr:hypothetical protein BaRGS_014868 [Batillaria attramentaria]